MINSPATEKNKVAYLVSLISGIVISLLVFATGICFAISCAHIYFTGGQRPFTYDSIGTHFSYIAIPTVLTVAAVIAGGVVSLIFPTESKTLGKITVMGNLKLLSAKVKSVSEEVKAQRRYRTLVRIIAGAVFAILITIALIAALSHGYETEDINGHIASVCLISLPISLTALCILIAASFLTSASAEKEIKMLKELLKNPTESSESKRDGILDKVYALPETAKQFYGRKEKSITLIARITVFCVATVFIVLGIINGGMADVLGKAVRICTECIGLG